MSKAFANCQPTQQMQAVGLTFGSIENYARKAVDLIQTHGDDVIDVFDAGFRAFSAATQRDFPTLFVALNDANRSAATVVAAIRTEFGF